MNGGPLVDILHTAVPTTAQDSQLPHSFPLVFPFPPNHRNKRKPQRFRSKGESKFSPQNGGKRNLLEIFQASKSFSDRKKQSKKSRFASFPKQPSPSPVKHTVLNNLHVTANVQLGETTLQPSLELEDFLGSSEGL